MKQKHRFSPPAVGASALLVSFAVLVLCVFALLSVSSVQAEARLADASAANTEAYYAADLEAEEIFARLRGGELPPQVEIEEAIYRYHCTLSDYQQLQVTLRRNGRQWTVLQWQVVAEDVPESDQRLNVWNGT